MTGSAVSSSGMILFSTLSFLGNARAARFSSHSLIMFVHHYSLFTALEAMRKGKERLPGVTPAQGGKGILKSVEVLATSQV